MRTPPADAPRKATDDLFKTHAGGTTAHEGDHMRGQGGCNYSRVCIGKRRRAFKYNINLGRDVALASC